MPSTITAITYFTFATEKSQNGRENDQGWDVPAGNFDPIPKRTGAVFLTDLAAGFAATDIVSNAKELIASPHGLDSDSAKRGRLPGPSYRLCTPVFERTR
jgi:hypothetical protein